MGTHVLDRWAVGSWRHGQAIIKAACAGGAPGRGFTGCSEASFA
ncbi:hypothetical protein CVCC1112_3112 [Paenarthrobacter nicotinovorans]|nr:hypothetical protein CVCC1112_3112 [Paenarthrobacter nicotinovorans]